MLAIAGGVAASSGEAASGSITVTFAVPSSTSVSTASCATGDPSRTTLGVVLPGTSAVTTADCTVGFGSTNDSSMLRVRQHDGIGRGMWMAAHGAGDATCGTGGTTVVPIGTGNNSAFGGVMQPDGKVVMVGYAYNGTTNEFAVSRTNTDGTPDTAFGTGGVARHSVGTGTSQARAVVVQPDGKLLVTGYAIGAGAQDTTVIRLNADGSLDTGFGTGGAAITAVVPGADQGRDLVLQPDGKIVVTGVASNGSNDDMVTLRYTAAGALDTTFGTGGKVIEALGTAEDAGNSVDVLTNGRIVVGGHTFDGAFDDAVIIRYDAAGARDGSFGSGGLARLDIGSGHDRLLAIAAQSDGRIVGGGSSSNGTNDDFAVLRVDSAGVLDPTFSDDGWIRTPVNVTDVINGLDLMGDGRIVVAGATDDGTTTDVAVARYETDGRLDTSFSDDGVDRAALATGHDQARGAIVGADGAIIAIGYRHNGSDWDFVARRYGSTQLVDYASASANWTVGTSMFGACLRAVGGGATVDGTTWSATGSCTATNADPWRAIATGGAVGTKVASAPAGTTTATASLRFGVRTPVTQTPGRYVAPITFEVLAPSS